MPEEESKPVDGRNPKRDARTIPESASGFRYFNRVEMEFNGEILRGRIKNYSGWYYLTGTRFTLSEVRRYLPEEKTMIQNMEWSAETGCQYDVLMTVHGQFIQLFKGDKVINPVSILKMLARKDEVQ